MLCAKPCSICAARSGRAPRRSPAAAPTPAWSPGSSSRRCSNVAADCGDRRRRALDARGLGAARAQARASRAFTSPNAIPSARRRQSRAASSSTPGRSRALSRKACSRPNSAGARMRNICRRKGSATLSGRDCAIYLLRPGAGTRVRSWTPTAKAQHGWLITHNEVDLDRRLSNPARRRKTVYRPTCHYAYRPPTMPCFRSTRWRAPNGSIQEKSHILDENEIVDGIDELGVLALWPCQKCLLVWLATLDRGDAAHRALSECDRPASVLRRARRHGLGAGKSARPGLSRPTNSTFAAASKCSAHILAPSSAHYTDWTPLEGRAVLFPEDIDTEDPWQFKNVLVR